MSSLGLAFVTYYEDSLVSIATIKEAESITGWGPSINWSVWGPEPRQRVCLRLQTARPPLEFSGEGRCGWSSGVYLETEGQGDTAHSVSGDMWVCKLSPASYLWSHFCFLHLRKHSRIQVRATILLIPLNPLYLKIPLKKENIFKLELLLLLLSYFCNLSNLRVETLKFQILQTRETYYYYFFSVTFLATYLKMSLDKRVGCATIVGR